MIDIHCHILPGVDDGPRTEKECLAMAEVAIQQGITQIVATPHHRNNVFDNYKPEVVNHVAILNDLMATHSVPLTILPGQEIRIYGELLQDYDNSNLLPINNSKYILIEFPNEAVPQYTDQLFYDMQLRGLVPVIAHPERNQELLDKPIRMYQLIRNGALSQITAGSVLGKWGKQVDKFTQLLIRSNLTHFIASDAHHITKRGFDLMQAYDFVHKQFGSKALYMFYENSELLVDNMNVNREEPSIPDVKRKLFGLF